MVLCYNHYTDQAKRIIIKILKEIKLIIECNLLIRALLFTALPIAVAFTVIAAPESTGIATILDTIGTWVRNIVCFIIAIGMGLVAVKKVINPSVFQSNKIKDFADAFEVGTIGKKSRALWYYQLISGITIGITMTYLLIDCFYFDMTSTELVKYIIALELISLANSGLLCTLFEIVLDGVNKVLAKTNKDWYLISSEILRASSYGATIEIFTPTEKDIYGYSIIKFYDDDTAKVISTSTYCTRC
jgi:hypothetical protein